jgi:hypothetical protein
MRQFHDQTDTDTAIASGSWLELVGAMLGVVAAFLGLIGRIPLAMASLSVLAVGLALFGHGVGLAMRWKNLSERVSKSRLSAMSAGIAADLVGGGLAVIGGALALARVYPLIVMPAAAIAVGVALVLAGPAQLEVATLPPEGYRYEDLGRTSSGVQVIGGVAAVVLGVLALVTVGPIVTLGLIAALVAGAVELISGGTLSSRFQARAP